MRLLRFPGLLLLSVLLSVPGVADETNRFGLNAHVPQGEQLTLLDPARDSGAGWIRVDLDWRLVETAQDIFDWSAYDALADAAAARGLTIFATLAYTPAWATDGAAGPGVPRSAADWADFCSRAAQRYAGKIRWWGLWNEPNLPEFWAGTRQQYVDVILVPGADAIHAASPLARVAGPELSHSKSGSSDWYRWLPDILAQAGTHLDVVTHHIYDADGAADLTVKLDAQTSFGAEPAYWDFVNPSLREVLALAGWLGRPVWITETGWASDDVGEDTQAAHVANLLATWFTAQPGKSWIQKVFFYELIDDGRAGIKKFGLLRADRTTKPSYAALRTFIASRTAGDVNGDGVLSVADILYLINYLFAAGPPPLGPADADASGVVDVLDALYLINTLFSGGPPPA